MKFLLCTKCEDIIRVWATPRTCACGNVSAKYLDTQNAVFQGRHAVPFGLSSVSLTRAIAEEKYKGFRAYVIEEPCTTFARVDKAIVEET